MAAVNLKHPQRDQLEAFLGGRLTEHEQLLVETHVSQCDSCCEELRCVPHDSLVDRLRLVDTSSPGETQALPGPAGPDTPHEIPRELMNHARYRIVRQLGAGGMGVVYRAEHRVMERAVALKVIHHRLVSNPLAIERFHQEVKAAARLAHRNIVTAYDAEQAGNLHFLVMEFVEGASLSDVVKRRGPVPVQHACNYMWQAAMGLAHAHEHGMVHRDIKPQNMMRTPKGVIKILDFGLARFASQQNAEESGLTTAGATVGTPDYISPEQARDSRRADIRSDIYSLGCTFYYLLTGRPPFPDGTAIEKFISHSEHEPTPVGELRSDVPAEVQEVVERMMAKLPADRFQTPGELVEALKPLGKPGSEVATSATVEQMPTLVDTSPALAPLDQLDALAAQQSTATALLTSPAWSYTPSRRGTNWRRLWQRNQQPILTAGGVAMILLALLWLGPKVYDLAVADHNDPNSASKSSLIPQSAPPARDRTFAGSTMPDPNEKEWIDLLPKLNPAQHAVAGSWRRSGYALEVEASENARLAVPFKPPEEYDLEVRFTRNSGRLSIAVIFPAGPGQASLEFDAWGRRMAGIQNIGGKSLQEQPSPPMLGLDNGSSHVALLQVRRQGVKAFLDGKLVHTYEGDGSDLSLLKGWQLPHPRMIGVGAFNSSATFHCIRVRPAK